MGTILFYGLVLVAMASAFVEIEVSYHEKVGIPTAERIRAYEIEQLIEEAGNEFSRIAGGMRADDNDHPYLAGLKIDLQDVSENSVCGSSLLTANRLVTAAHCWFDGHDQAWQFLVVLGTNFLYSGGLRIPTGKVIMHPLYSSDTLNNDLAMIYLPIDVEFSERIQPISLAYGSELNNRFVGYWAVAAGFGRTRMDDGPSKAMNHVNIQVITLAACRTVFNPIYVRQSTICTDGTGGVGICAGDSGGPLITKLNNRLILIGISSFVVKDGCHLGYPSAYTRVTSYHHFITGHLDATPADTAEIIVFEAEKIRAYEESILADEVFGGQNRIVGGSLAPTNAHPHFAGLLISLVNVAGNSVCGSSLLSTNRLVTAAHCWSDGWNQAWQFTVILGTNFLFTGGTRIDTTHVILHPQWTPSNLNNDVAMIYLPTNVLLSASISPIAIPSATELSNQFVGQWPTAVGFGRTSDQQVGASTVVSQVNLQVITVAACQTVFGLPWVQTSTLCTNGAGGVGVCSGDSGGPLAVQYNGRLVLIGISSFVAAAGCQLGHPSAFARVTSFHDFITQHL